MNRLLYVEDSAEVSMILAATFADFQCRHAKTIAEARESLASEDFDLLLLDIELPDGSGLDLFAELKDHQVQTPAIFLTGKDDMPTKAKAFKLGADDFVKKPFSPEELKLRVEAKIENQRRIIQNQVELRFGDVVCKLAEQKAYIVGHNGPTALDLTLIEFRILLLFMREPEPVHSRKQIVERAWSQGTNVTERAVDVHVSNLRKKLKSSKLEIEAVPGEGYCLLPLD